MSQINAPSAASSIWTISPNFWKKIWNRKRKLSEELVFQMKLNKYTVMIFHRSDPRSDPLPILVLSPPEFLPSLLEHKITQNTNARSSSNCITKSFHRYRSDLTNPASVHSNITLQSQKHHYRLKKPKFKQSPLGLQNWCIQLKDNLSEGFWWGI